MSVLLSKEFLESVEDMAFSILRDLEEETVRAMINGKGLAYGDVELNRVDRIMKFLMDDADGVNDTLQMSDPDEYRRRLRQFQRDAQEAGLI